MPGTTSRAVTLVMKGFDFHISYQYSVNGLVSFFYILDDINDFKIRQYINGDGVQSKTT